jgi:hypothetical protein
MLILEQKISQKIQIFKKIKKIKNAMLIARCLDPHSSGKPFFQNFLPSKRKNGKIFLTQKLRKNPCFSVLELNFWKIFKTN